MAKATRETMLKFGLIIELPVREDIYAGIPMTFRQFDMPTSVHMAWCKAMSAESYIAVQKAKATWERLMILSEDVTREC